MKRSILDPLPGERIVRAAILLMAFLIALPALGWDAELKNAASAVANGTATPAQQRLVRQNNDVVNRMATQGELPDKVYQKVQQDFADFNSDVAGKAAKDAGLDFGKQKASSKTYKPGTDSDYIMKNADPNKPVTVEQIKQAKSNYNTEMNQRLGTKDVDYARKLDTDLMANPKGMTDAEFKKVGELQNDAYTRKKSAAYEAKSRAGEKITAAESKAYTDEMLDMGTKKSKQIQKVRQDAINARKTDPTGSRATTKDLDAKMTTKMQQQAKYNDRLNTETKRIATEADIKAPETSDLTGKAANRSTAPTDGLSEPKVARKNLKQASAANAMEGHLTGQAVKNNAEVRAGAGSKAQTAAQRKTMISDAADMGNKLKPSEQGELIESVRQKYGDKTAKDLTAEMRKQKAATDTGGTGKRPGDVEVSKTRVDGPDGPKTRVDGPDAPKTRVDAPDAPKTRVDGPEVKVSADVNAPKGPRVDGDAVTSGLRTVGKGAKVALEKTMVGLDIGNTAQDVLDVADGKKSVGQAAVDTVDRFSGGAISTTKMVVQKGSDYNEAAGQTEYARNQYEEARVIETGIELRKAGVSKEETQRIMAGMRKGDEGALQQKVGELKESGVDVTVPEVVKVDDVQGDDTVGERLVQVGTSMKDEAVRAGTFVKKTGENLAEIGTGLTEKGVAAELYEQQKKNLTADNLKEAPGAIIDIIQNNRTAYLANQTVKQQRQGLIERLVARGADANEAAAAVDAFQGGNSKDFRALRKRLDDEKKKKEAEATIAMLPPKTPGTQDSKTKPGGTGQGKGGTGDGDDDDDDDDDGRTDGGKPPVTGDPPEGGSGEGKGDGNTNAGDGQDPGDGKGGRTADDLRKQEGGGSTGDSGNDGDPSGEGGGSKPPDGGDGDEGKGPTPDDDGGSLLGGLVDNKNAANANTTKNAVALTQQQNGLSQSANIADDANRNNRNTIETAQNNATQIKIAAANNANTVDAQNSLGEQLTSGAEGAIQSGMSAVGTAIGTAAGQKAVRDANRDDRKNRRDGDKTAQTQVTQTSSSSSSGSRKGSKSGSKSGSKGSKSGTKSGSGVKKPPVSGGIRCSICGRINCPWVTGAKKK